VEMEFSVDFIENPSRKGDMLAQFAILQVRAMAASKEQFVPKLSMNEIPTTNTNLCYSRQALGHGVISDIQHVVYVSMQQFNINNTIEVAKQIENVTKKLHEEKKPYILIGPGRWGTASPHLGIPVTWQQISGAGCIVETALGDGQNVPSQGSHFFQNITSFDIPYFTIGANGESGEVNYEWLEKFDKARTTSIGCVRLLDLENPVQVVVDGVSRCGVVMLPEYNYEVFVDQANAFLDMANLPCA